MYTGVVTNIPGRVVSNLERRMVTGTKLTRNIREDANVDNAEAKSSTNVEPAVEDSHFICNAMSNLVGHGVRFEPLSAPILAVQHLTNDSVKPSVNM